MEPVEKVMGDSGFKKTEIAEVVLVGGSTRISKVTINKGLLQRKRTKQRNQP